LKQRFDAAGPVDLLDGSAARHDGLLLADSIRPGSIDGEVDPRWAYLAKAGDESQQVIWAIEGEDEAGVVNCHRADCATL
jgi:hypothetical protein